MVCDLKKMAGLKKCIYCEEFYNSYKFIIGIYCRHFLLDAVISLLSLMYNYFSVFKRVVLRIN
jgi:hypothetical protein